MYVFGKIQSHHDWSGPAFMVLCITKWVNVLIQLLQDSFRDGRPGPACFVGPGKHRSCCQVVPLLQLRS